MVLNLILHIEIYSPEGFEKSAYISPDGQNFPIWHKKGSKERKFSSEIKMGVLAQNLAMARSWGSEGRMDGPLVHVSSIYWTITRDSQIGLSSWIRTGIFLWTWLDLRRSSLLLMISSVINS
ncbi:uncharacterized protein LOC132626132 isoform X1 [Lycium barbarum]|uniref:uncharacterized protein LOC132626132 isoform X1 n=1 Tax=Lycium barbarum TaxID=112863 RepID=UPI00293E69F8|nr:uncharacterized protein LOC132626132 isoform X1 [Lycium barbarum]